MNTNQKHVLIITSEFPPLPGGIGNHACNLAINLQHSGYRVEVIADQRDDNFLSEAAFDAALPIQVHRIPLKKRRWLMYVRRIRLAIKLLKRCDVAIFSGKFPLWLGGFLSHFYKTRFIAVIHGSEVNYTQLLLRASINVALKRFDHIIAVSNYTKDLVAHLKLKHMVVIPNGFNPSKWKSANGKTEPLIGNPSLLTVGHVTARKGQLEVVKQLPNLLREYPNAHYHCVGFPSEQERVINEAKILGIANRITFHGHVSHNDLQRFYQGADIFVMLSKETPTGDVEGFGIAILEANYFGLPAIGAKGCGIEDAINDGESGVLVNLDNPMALVEANKNILEHLEVYKQAAYSWAVRHDWQHIVKRYIKVIEA